MKKRLLFILCLFSLASGAALAQTKTVTNKDLEKFRQTRLQAERDYRENYAKLGFPSPEELERKRVRDAKERGEFAERLRRENLEREKIQSEIDYRRAQLSVLQNNYGGQSYNRAAYNGGSYNRGVYFGSYYPTYDYSTYGYQNRYFYKGYGTNSYGRNGGFFYNSPGIFPHPGARFNSGGGGVRISITAGGGGGRRY